MSPTPAIRRPVQGHAMIRHAVPADGNYISCTWWRSMLGRDRAPRIRRRLNAAIDRVLDDATTRALVADRAGRIIGWLVYAETPIGRVVHYAYVRDDDRGQGVAARLLKAAWPSSDARFVFTLKGPATDRFIARHDAVFVPLEDFLK